MPQGYEGEPVIDKGSSRQIVNAIIGNQNCEMQEGNLLTLESLVVAGPIASYYSYAAHLQKLGVDVGKDVRQLAMNTKAMSKEIPDFGAVGMAKELITGTMPKTEKVKEGGTGILRRPQPQPQEQLQK